MRLLIVLVTNLLVGFVSTETLVRVTTPESSTEVSADSFNSTFIEQELSESDQDQSDDDQDEKSSEETGKLSEDEKNDDSDVSDEANEVEMESDTDPKAPNPIITSNINSTFVDKKSFLCPRVKSDLKTGTTVGDLSPEDISFIASMGDGVASGLGLWRDNTEVEFRGASFVAGGDANIDGLVTIPNILREFSPDLEGVANGMGDVNSNPRQLSIATKGAHTKDLPAQAKELLLRMRTVYGGRPQHNNWTLIFIAIGTEELCEKCAPPDERGLSEALGILHNSLQKALIVLLGPTHLSHHSARSKNLLKQRCNCSRGQQPGFMEGIAAKWTAAFERLQDEYDAKRTEIGARQTFGLLSFPQLTVTSRKPEELFAPTGAIISRKGHSYMSKWLWNKLMSGVKYNLTNSNVQLSTESYFCPSSGCPYFRTTMNMRVCTMLTKEEAKDYRIVPGEKGEMVKMRRNKQTLYSIAVAVVIICFIVALIVGIIIYNISKRAVHGRFDEVPETVASPDPPKVSVVEGGGAPISRKNALNRQSTRSTLDVPPPVYGGGSRKSPDRSESMQLLTEP